MRGRVDPQAYMFSYFSPESRVPADHPLRSIKAHTDRVLKELSGEDKKPKPGKDKQPGVPEEAVTLLATELHISADRARQVFKDLDKVNGKSGDVVKDPAFVAIAKARALAEEGWQVFIVGPDGARYYPSEFDKLLSFSPALQSRE